MKKTLLTLILGMCCLTASFAQDNAEASEIAQQQTKQFVYCELLGMSKLLSNSISVSVDMGQEVKLFSAKNTTLVDENNKPIVFNSMIDAMNYMGRRGWEFVQAYVTTSGQSYVYRWILKKDVSLFSSEEQSEIMKDLNLNQ